MGDPIKEAPSLSLVRYDKTGGVAVCYLPVGQEVSKVGRATVCYYHSANSNLLVLCIPDHVEGHAIR
eukprot:1671434-Ditylum_brightwellii.AAC.1